MGPFSFQADETEQGVSVPALVHVLCRSVGVLLAEDHAEDAGAQSLVEPEASPTVAVRGCQNDGDLT